MKVDIKNNEQPLAVAQYRSQLAEMCGVKERSISQHMCRQRKLNQNCCYRKVVIESEE